MRTSVLFAVAALLVAVSTPAFAQRAEVSAFVGWTKADGVSGDTIAAGDGNRYNRVDPKDSASWGLGIGIFANENAEVGFLFGQQKTELDAKGTNTRKIDDLTINSYHPYSLNLMIDGTLPGRPRGIWSSIPSRRTAEAPAEHQQADRRHPAAGHADDDARPRRAE